MLAVIKKNYFFYIFLSVYIIIGSYLSITNGITSDEYHEQLNWEINSKAIINYLGNRNYDELLNYGDRYHGIGFHLLSQPIQFISYKFVSSINDITLYGGYLISKHLSVFLLFTISGIFFYLLCIKISKDFLFSLISTILYLLYPYLFGHAQFNPKDMPFLSFWLINTYVYLTLIENIFYENKIKIYKIIFFAFLTAFLISIRITGIIILVQYLVGIVVLYNVKKFDILYFIKKNFLIFTTALLIFIYLLNPIFWHNPLEIFNAIEWMSKYHNDICTLTLGDCMRSLNLPSSYYFIWLFFKLPIIIILGILIFPLVEEKIFKDKVRTIYYLTLLISFFAILFVFIFKNVAIYDELRHVIFIVPIIFLIGLINLFFLNKKTYFGLSLLTLLFFTIENINLNPYQYTWLNSFAKFTEIEKNFEIDYWGVSNKNLSKKLIEHANQNSIDKNICIYGDIYAKEFLLTQNFNCFKTYSQLDEVKIRPLFAYQNLRNVKRSKPKDCELIWNETYQYSFYKKNISAGKLWFCN